MSKYGFNPKELRKTIITQIDKDGFHNRTVTYGKDSGGSGSGDFSRATITIHNESRFNFYYCCPRIIEDEDDESLVPYLDASKLGPFGGNENVSFETVLYKNVLELPFDVIFSFADGLTSIATFYIACTVLGSGNVEVVEDEDNDYNYLRITGDCEITIKNTVDGPV